MSSSNGNHPYDPNCDCATCVKIWRIQKEHERKVLMETVAPKLANLPGRCKVPACFSSNQDVLIEEYCEHHYRLIVIEAWVKIRNRHVTEAERLAGEITRANAKIRKAKAEAGIVEKPTFMHCQRGCGYKATGWNIIEEHERFCSGKSKTKAPSKPRVPGVKKVHVGLTEDDLT